MELTSPPNLALYYSNSKIVHVENIDVDRTEFSIFEKAHSFKIYLIILSAFSSPLTDTTGVFLVFLASH